jgi:hypothetical protein
MRELKENLPTKWGGMYAAYYELPAGTDLTPLLKGLPNDLCHCPHWGYVLKGSVNVRYTDGSEEVIKAGEVFYLPAGHTGWTEEETAFIDFSPEKEYEEVTEHVTKKRSEMA